VAERLIVMQTVERMKDLKRLPGECPDAEFLAVYLDGGLTSAERTLVEDHISNCGPCRRILAAAIRSEESVVFPSHTDES
jgi:anti-sigma factor ChrR (cupin superfamily)